MHSPFQFCMALSVMTIAFALSQPAKAFVTVSFVQVADDLTTNPLIFDGPFDVWHLVMKSAVDVEQLELSFNGQGEFLNTTNADFLDRGDLVNGLPQVLGMDAPGTAFVIPPGSAVIAENTLNDPSHLRSSYMLDTSVLDVPLVPGDGTPTPVAVFAVAGDSPLNFDATFIGRPFVAKYSIEAEMITASINDVVMHQFGDVDDFDIWSNLAVEMGDPLLAPSLTSDGKFTWDTTGSPHGNSFNPVAYEFSATVSTTYGFDIVGQANLTINLIPEPGALALMGLATLGLGVIRRR